MDAIPVGLLFIGTVIILYIAMELGYRAGNTHPDLVKKQKEKITSTNVTALLGTLGFIFVFTFGIVYSRYDSKKELVREEANLIRTAWLRADFLPEQDRAEIKKLFIRYTDIRLEAADSHDLDKLQILIQESLQIQKRIWDNAVENARIDMNSDVAAMYIDALNEMINQQAERIAVGVQARIPNAIWVLLYLLQILGMFAIGYEVALSGSSRSSWLTPVMVLSFAVMLMIIASLDRPDSSIITVTQQPFIDLRSFMEFTK
jgi:hypothetical protein